MQNQPQLEFLYEITAHLDAPLVIGENPHGNRQIVPVIGGTFEGPRLKGEVSSRRWRMAAGAIRWCWRTRYADNLADGRRRSHL
jgi:hypothetical protein